MATARDEVIGEIRTDEGVKCVFAQSKSPSPQSELFASIMRTHVRALAEQHDIRYAPLVISGMASSTIGWMPLAYASIPFGLDGSGLMVQRLDWETPPFVGPTLLVSGAANENDMMRGEECQVIGTFADTLNRPYRNSSVLILPGTHSKHIVVENERVIGLQTFMTGELFEVLSKHSILSASIDSSNDDFFFSGFMAGVHHVKKHGLAASLFRVRSRHVLEGAKPSQNRGFLSGILIAGELMDSIPRYDRPVMIAGKLSGLYRTALGYLELSGAIIRDDVDAATVAGHRTILSLCCQ